MPLAYTFCDCSVAQLCPILCNLCTAARQTSLSFTISRICSNSCPLSHQWMPSTILSSVVRFHITFLKSYKVSWGGNRGALLTSYTHVHTQHGTCPWVRFMGCPHHLAQQRDCGRPSICSWFTSVQSLKSCLALCDPIDHSTPGFPVHHQLLEFTQTHVYWVGDAIQPSHRLLSPSLPSFNLAQHQGLFKWVSSSHQVTEVLEFQLQHQSFQWTPKTDLLLDGLVGSRCSPGDSHHS